MILATPYAGQMVGVLGLGKSGMATVASLSAAGARVLYWDDKADMNAAAQYAHAKAMNPDEWPWEKLSAMVLSPGIPYTHPAPNPAVLKAQAANCPVIGDIEVLYQSCAKARYVGITGTNGKSTTTSLIGHILQKAGSLTQVGGNLGTAALSLAPLSDNGTYVLEMSSYQLDLVRTMRFNVAVLLNLSEDHIDRHGSMEGYFAAKQHIFDRQGKDDVAVIGVDDAWCESLAREMISAKRQRVIPVSVTQTVGNGVYVRDGILHNRLAADATCDLNGIKSLQGAHNWQNAAAAYAACYAHGVPHEIIAAAMQSFAGLPHRMQWLGEIGGVQFVNDSKATNADAAEKALKTYDDIYWIAGGVAKEGGIASLAPYFPKIRHAYLIGEASEAFARTLEGQVAYTKCGTLDVAFAQAARDATSGAVVLAPACASFDQYKNFEERGEHFIRLVETHKRGVAV